VVKKLLLGKRFYCFINTIKLNDIKKFARERFDTREYTIFHLTLTRVSLIKTNL